MPSVRKRGKKFEYRVTYIDDTGKQREVSKSGFNTSAEAKRAGKQLEAELFKSKSILKGNMIAYDYLMEFYRNKREDNLSEYTQKVYKAQYKLFGDYFADKKLKDISNYDYQNFIDHISKTRAKSTIQKIHARVSAGFRYAHANGFIQINPTYDINIKSNVKTKNKTEYFLQESEFKALLHSLMSDIKPDYVSRHLLILAMASGARFSELIGLTFDDYNAFTATIDINKSFDHLATKKLKETKTESSNRKVKIDDETNSIMKNYLSYQMGDLRNKNRYLFPSDTIDKPITHNSAIKVLRKHCKKVGIQDIGIHALRHTHASLLLLHGVNIEYIASRLGHVNSNTTREFYLHIVEEMKKKSDENVISIFNAMH